MLEFRLNLHDRSRHTASERPHTSSSMVCIRYCMDILTTIDSIAWEVGVTYSPLNINVTLLGDTSCKALDDFK